MMSQDTFLRCRTAMLALLLALGGLLLMPAAARAAGEEPAEEPETAYIAGYPNTPEAWDKEELVIRCLFRSHGIRWFAAGTSDAAISVEKKDEDRARRLLAETLLLERLDIYLMKFSPEADRIVIVTPEEVLLGHEPAEKEPD